MAVDEGDNKEIASQEAFEKIHYYSFSFLDEKRHAVIIPEEDDWQMQEAIFCSTQLNSRTTTKTIDVKMKGICTSHPVEPYFDELSTWSPTFEMGESSWSQCVICGDDKPSGALKQGSTKCGHLFCEDCIRDYVRENIQENIHKINLKCPQNKCKEILSLEFCMARLPQKVLDRRSHALRENAVLAGPTIIECPFIDCCGELVDDEKHFLIRTCPNCWRIFCVRCRVRWHMGKSCHEFQLLKRIREVVPPVVILWI